MVKPLTIVQLLPVFDAGGVERGTLEINRALVQAGHRSIVVSSGGRLVKQLEAEGGIHVRMQIWKKTPLTLMTVPGLRKWICDVRPDILHARSRVPAWATWLAWRTLPSADRPRFITTVHGLNTPGIYSGIMLRGEHIIAVSDTARDYILQHYPKTDPRRITVIHRGVDPAEFPYGYEASSAWKSEWYLQYPQLRSQFVACLAGRVTRFKGHLDFLEAIAKLNSEGVRIHGLIVGSEDPRRKAYSTSLRERVRQLGLTGLVTFTGHRPDIKDVLSVSDVVVSTSMQPPESFGRAVLESVRLGRITLGYAHGGVNEVLSTVFPAGRIPYGDVATLAQRLKDAFEGRIDRPKAGPEYLLKSVLGKEIALYEQLCRSGEFQRNLKAG